MGPQSASDNPQSPREASAPRKLVSRREYARMRGVSEKAVRKAIQAGKIPTVDGMIDPEIADAAWARNRDAAQHSKLAEAIPGATAAEPPARTAASAISAPEAPAAPIPPGSAATSAVQQPTLELAPLTAARIRATEESAAIKEITRRKLEGSLLEAEEVDRTWAELLQALKDRLRLIPDNVGDALAITSDPAQCRSIVMKEIMDTLAVLSKHVEGMAA